MAKTYTALGTVAAGDVYTASAYNVMATNVNQFIVPPSVQLIRSSNLTSYTASSDITWSSAAWDTDGMFSAGSPTQITIQTTGLYLLSGMIQFSGAATITSANIDVYKSGNLWSRMIVPINATSVGGYTNPSYTLSCTAADTFTFRIGITGGSAYVITGNATETNNQSRIAMTWIGRTS